MVLFNMYGVFFSRFLESRKYKIQTVARRGSPGPGPWLRVRPPWPRSRIGLERDLSHSADCKVRLGQTGVGLQEERRHKGLRARAAEQGGVCARVCM